MATKSRSGFGFQATMLWLIAIFVLSSCEVLRQADSLIVNGRAAEPGEFPFMAAVRSFPHRDPNSFERCGGAIIDQHHILSSASCAFNRMNNPEDIRVGLGCHKITNCSATHHVAEVMIYPTYDGYINNVAILRLAQGIEFNNVSGPGAIQKIEPAEEELEDEEWGSLTVAGWGRVGYKGYSDTLLAADILAEPHRECVLRHRRIGEKEICARSPGKTACAGDSGGPLFKKRDGTFLQVGIASGGSCSWSSYYEKVASYRDWISDCTKGRQCATFDVPPLKTVAAHPVAAYVILIGCMVLVSFCCLFIAKQ